MTDHDHILKQLAEDRRRRMAATGRPGFNLTHDEIARSTHQAMRLAQASASLDEREPVHSPALAHGMTVVIK